MTDPLDGLLEDLVLEPGDVIDMTTMSRPWLLRRQRVLDIGLADRGESLLATTEEGRFMQSERDAIRVALKTRTHW